jgi:hypothetical protein
MRFFLDNNQPQQLATLLEAFDMACQVRHLSIEFDPATPDVEWLAELGRRVEGGRPAIIGGDAKILRNAAEAQVLRESGLTFFLMADGWSGMKWSERAWKMIRVWPRIVENASPRRPSVFRVTVQEKVELYALTEHLGRK